MGTNIKVVLKSIFPRKLEVNYIVITALICLAYVLGLLILYRWDFSSHPLLSTTDEFADRFADYKHGIQLASTLYFTATPIFISFLAFLITNIVAYLRDRKDFGMRSIALIRYPLYFLAFVALVHFITWWVIEPQCVGCMTDEGWYSLGVNTAMLWILVLMASLMVILSAFIKNAYFIALRNEIVHTCLYFIILTISIPLYFLMFALSPLFLIYR